MSSDRIGHSGQVRSSKEWWSFVLFGAIAAGAVVRIAVVDDDPSIVLVLVLLLTMFLLAFVGGALYSQRLRTLGRDSKLRLLNAIRDSEGPPG